MAFAQALETGDYVNPSDAAAQMKRMTPRAVYEVVDVFLRAGHRAWPVGGCVRDSLLGRKAGDWDLATSARPEVVTKLFRNTIPTGLAHGTVTVRWKGESFEVTTLRGETTYSDGRHPDQVVFLDDIESDLARRDFTVNAMAYDSGANVLVDPWNGLADLEAGLIRAVGEAHQRFSEDGLRAMRAARFCSTLEFQLDPETERAIPNTLESFRKIACERIQVEWTKALGSRKPSKAFAVMARTGLLEACLPNGVLVPIPSPNFDALDETSKEFLHARLAILLLSLKLEEEAAAVLSHLRFGNQDTAKTLRLLAAWNAQRSSNAMETSALRELAVDLGRPLFEAFESMLRSSLALPEQHGRFVQATSTASALSIGELAVDGGVLMQETDLRPGKQMGELLKALLRYTLQNPEQNTKAMLLQFAKTWLADLAPLDAQGEKS